MSVKECIFIHLFLSQAYGLCPAIRMPRPRTSEYPQTSAVFTSPTMLWKSNVVTVSFVNGDCNQRSTVRKVAFEWTPFSNINFVFIDEPYEGDIRVGFYESMRKSWSFVGMESKYYSYDIKTNKWIHGKDGISMNFYQLYRSTILHEFGRR